MKFSVKFSLCWFDLRHWISPFVSDQALSDQSIQDAAQKVYIFQLCNLHCSTTSLGFEVDIGGLRKFAF